jgi:hypothetical protein
MASKKPAATPKADPKKPNAASKVAAGKSLIDFRAEHDKSFIVPKRIRDGLAKLGNGWLYEVEFLRLTGLSTTDCAAYREEFSEYLVTVGGRVTKRIWVGSKELAKKMREMTT